MAPMGDSLADADGTVSDAQLAYFEARARGGAALLLVGSVAVAYPDGCVDEHQVAASDDAHLPGLTALADRVHAHGAAVAAQLTYNGALGPPRHRARPPDARSRRAAPAPPRPPLDHGHRDGARRVHGALRVAHGEGRVPGGDRRGPRRGRRALRRERGPLPAGRHRRRGAPCRARLPDRRVPVTVDQHPNRRLGRRRGAPRAAPGRDRRRDPRARRARLPPLDADQCARVPQARRRDTLRAARGRPPRGRGRPRRGTRHRVRQHGRRDRARPIPTRPIASATWPTTPRRCAQPSTCRSSPSAASSPTRRRRCLRRVAPTSSRWAASCSPIPICRTSSQPVASRRSVRASTSTGASATSS